MAQVISLIILGLMIYVVYHQYDELNRKYLKRKQRKEKWKKL